MLNFILNLHCVYSIVSNIVAQFKWISSYRHSIRWEGSSAVVLLAPSLNPQKMDKISIVFIVLRNYSSKRQNEFLNYLHSKTRTSNLVWNYSTGKNFHYTFIYTLGGLTSLENCSVNWDTGQLKWCYYFDKNWMSELNGILRGYALITFAALLLNTWHTQLKERNYLWFTLVYSFRGFSPQSLAPLALGLWWGKYRGSWSMWNRMLFTSWQTRSREGEGTWEQVQLQDIPPSCLLVPRFHLLKFLGSPKIAPPAGDQVFNTAYGRHFIFKLWQTDYSQRTCFTLKTLSDS
jgi:hypothetical protein